jgi:nitrate/nitrite transport system substrate-binding protein
MTHPSHTALTPAPAVAGERIEKPELTLGFMPLTDCAPLVAALEQGFFAEAGLRVTLSREVSWANIRDKVAAGALDGAQMLAPMPLAAGLPNPAAPVPLVTALSLGLNGNTIVVSTALHAAMTEAGTEAAASPGACLATVARQRREQGRPLRFGMVFPYSTHNYLLRYWLAAHGLHPDRDLRLEVVPPPFMVEALQAGEIEGFCVGEPWGRVAVDQGVGRVLLADDAVWNHHPEKVFAVTETFADRYPVTHRALLVALLRAARWLDAPGQRASLAPVLARAEYVRAPEAMLRQSLLGEAAPGAGAAASVFFRYAATFPWRSHALWLLTQMARWGQIEAPTSLRSIAERVYRPDLYREAAALLGLACPTVDDKDEGWHAADHGLAAATGPLTLGADRFYDGQSFDPRDPIGYLSRHEPQSRRGAIAAWRLANP